MNELDLLHVHGSAIGYGRLGVELAKALTAKGVDVYDHLPSPDTPDPRDGYRSKVTNVACWVSVPGHVKGWWDRQHLAIFTMWEATRLPESFRENLHHFDTVIVPSDQNLELFSDYHPNVKVAYLGVDPDVWHYQPREIPEREFRFLVGGSGPRKGVDLVYRAFLTLWGRDGSWGDGPIPTLTLKSPKGGEFFGPRIKMISGRIPAEDEIGLYASAHCYVQPSRGEGFGLQPLQAIAQGCPTVLTGAHGHASFAEYGYPIGSTLTPADYFVYGDAGEWWEPNFDELVERMRWVYDHYQEACAHAEIGAKEVARRFTWADCAEQFLDGIGRDHLTVPYQGARRWETPESLLYPVRVLRRWVADVAGDRYVLEPGVSYYVPADVKRILFEGGKLDPACIDDGGLAPSQVAHADGYRWDKLWCPTCDQQLNSGIRKQDVILEQMS